MILDCCSVEKRMTCSTLIVEHAFIHPLRGERLLTGTSSQGVAAESHWTMVFSITVFMFLVWLNLLKDAEIRSHLLTKLNQDPKLTLKTVAEECQRILNLRHDTKKIEGKYIVQVQTATKGEKWLHRIRVNAEEDFILRRIARSKIKCFQCGSLGHRQSYGKSMQRKKCKIF